MKHIVNSREKEKQREEKTVNTKFLSPQGAVSFYQEKMRLHNKIYPTVNKFQSNKIIEK